MLSASKAFRVAALCGIGGTGIGLFFSWSFWGALLGCSIAIVGLVSWRPKNLAAGAMFLGVLLAVFLGAWFRSADSMSYWESLPDSHARLRRAVVESVEQSEESKRVVLKPVSCEGEACPFARALGIFPSFADIREGDDLSLSCVLERPTRISPDFDYAKVLAKDGIGYMCRFPKDWKKEGVSENMFSALARMSRESVERVLGRSIPEPESGLILGLIVGGDGRLPKSVQEEFSRTGLSHIVAVSGYNISIIAVIFMDILIFLGLYRQQAFWGAVMSIAFFTLLVGAPASAVRAALMVSVALLATRMDRVGNPINGILLAACAMLFVNPLLLRYDIGFQLSFAATLGIFLVTPFALLSLRMGDIGATTLSAELFVLPVILFHFHSLPILSLLVNLLVLPLVPIAMALGVFAFCLDVVAPWAAAIFSFPAFLVSRVILEIINLFASLSFVSISIPNFGMLAGAAWYVALFAAVFFFRKKYPFALSIS